jgi:hypothetical protein
MSRSSRALASCWAVAALAALCGCAREQRSAEPASAPATTRPPLPIAAFVAPEPFVPRLGDAEPVAPLDLSRETWRIFVERDAPLQRRTPRWQALPAERAVQVTMPAPSRFECHVTPAEVTAVTDDYATELRGWRILRSLVCSRDGFASWTQHPHRVRVELSGEREVEIPTHAYLRERIGDAEHHIRIILRSDARTTSASVGPPRIVARTALDDD